MQPLPVDFEERVKRPKGETGSDYPYAIKAADLMRNFVYAALDADETLVEETTGQGGHRARKLAIPPVPGGNDPVQLTAEGGSLSWSAATSGIPEPPSSGTHVLGAVDGALAWIETEACD
jgi:hypothetical protein